MGKRKDKDGADGGSARRGDGYDSEAVKSFVERIETVQGEIDEIRQAAKDECQPHREDIEAIKKEAHDAGISRAALNAKLQERRLRRKADSVRGNLTEQVQDNFDQLSKALGDFGSTELGKAAAARVQPSAEERATTH